MTHHLDKLWSCALKPWNVSIACFVHDIYIVQKYAKNQINLKDIENKQIFCSAGMLGWSHSWAAGCSSWQDANPSAAVLSDLYFYSQFLSLCSELSDFKVVDSKNVHSYPLKLIKGNLVWWGHCLIRKIYIKIIGNPEWVWCSV